MTEISLERRIQMLEDRAEIQNLVARYGFVIDDREMDRVAACFTEDGGLAPGTGSSAPAAGKPWSTSSTTAGRCSDRPTTSSTST